jgi:uncharacterized protein YjbJ (UPF0337 family)
VDWADIEANWDAFQAQLHNRWGRLTDEDLRVARASRDALVNCVIKRYGVGAEIVQRHVDDWVKSASLPSERLHAKAPLHAANDGESGAHRGG